MQIKKDWRLTEHTWIHRSAQQLFLLWKQNEASFYRNDIEMYFIRNAKGEKAMQAESERESWRRKSKEIPGMKMMERDYWSGFNWGSVLELENCFLFEGIWRNASMLSLIKTIIENKFKSLLSKLQKKTSISCLLESKTRDFSKVYKTKKEIRHSFCHECNQDLSLKYFFNFCLKDNAYKEFVCLYIHVLYFN